MEPKVQLAALRKTKWSEYAVRFFLGGCICAATGIIARRWGPISGGLFLAFPAIFPASATLVQKHEKEGDRGQPAYGSSRGRRAAGLDAVGSAIGSIGLLAFALIVWRLLPNLAIALVLIVGTLGWLVVAVVLWYLRRRIPTKLPGRISNRKARANEYSSLRHR
jgi:hypothetical protein